MDMEAEQEDETAAAGAAGAPRVVVGVDFGTTFSGFAFCLKSDPGTVHSFYEWPNQAKGGSKPYCKTQTSLLYLVKKGSRGREAASLRDSDYELKSWGWSAQVDYLEALQAASKRAAAKAEEEEGRHDQQQQEEEEVEEVGYLVKRFKVRLATRQPPPKPKPVWGGGKQERPDVMMPGSDDDYWGRRGGGGGAGSAMRMIRRVSAVRMMTRRILGARGRHSCSSPMARSAAVMNNNRQQQQQCGGGGGAVGEELEAAAGPRWVWPHGAGCNKPGGDSEEQQQQSRDESKPSGADHRQDDDDTDEYESQLPPGLSVERAITDYLARLADFIMEHLQATYGKAVTRRDVQWCLTVPAMWDDRAKHHMRSCAERAGMVAGLFCPAERAGEASPHPLRIVLESEAASVYCVAKAKVAVRLERGAQFLVADVGGGTADIVVHVKQQQQEPEEEQQSGLGRGLEIHEARQSTGGLCGGSRVDANFLDFLARRIGCFRAYVSGNPMVVPVLLRRWEEIKCTFDGSSAAWDQCVEFEVPRKLAAAWEAYDARQAQLVSVQQQQVQQVVVPQQQQSGSARRHQHQQQQCNSTTKTTSYDEVSITCAEMKAIFDPVIDDILSLIRAHMSPPPQPPDTTNNTKNNTTNSIKVLMAVGGFSASPYLRRRLKGAFGLQVEDLIFPPDPGSAICQGAVIMGAAPAHSIITSRVARRSYGIATFRAPSAADPPGSRVLCDGRLRCRDGFHVFVRRGDRLGVHHCVRQSYAPALDDQRGIRFDLFSSPAPSPPAYVTDPGVRLEGSFLFDISHDPDGLGKRRNVVISMYFGRSCIEVRAQRLNFGDVRERVRLRPLMEDDDGLDVVKPQAAAAASGELQMLIPIT